MRFPAWTDVFDSIYYRLRPIWHAFRKALYSGLGIRRFGQAYFERTFEVRDPWGFERREYEQVKYAQTLAALPVARFRNVLEVGCAEGVFTTQLADRCDRLLGIDISQRALARARERCAAFPKVDLQECDIFTQQIGSGFDLIVCAEVLCFSERGSVLDDTCRKIVDSIDAAGHLVVVHLRVSHEHPAGWTARDLAFGADSIHPRFRAMPDLSVVSDLWDDRYSISVFKKAEAASS